MRLVVSLNRKVRRGLRGRRDLLPNLRAAMALAEVFQKPTTMMYRNFLAMETEELLRSYPVDGCVLMGGCDKTTPALIMGATSMNLPSIYLPAGPMLNSHWRDQTLGSGSDTWKYWDELRAACKKMQGGGIYGAALNAVSYAGFGTALSTADGETPSRVRSVPYNRPRKVSSSTMGAHTLASSASRIA